MKKAIYILISLLLCLPAFAGTAQDNYSFIHINSSNSGLSYDDCRVIFQDSRGFMWYGTYKGLNRYDGQRFVAYDRNDLCGISDFIHAIAEDNYGNLWIGTDNGLLIYDYRLDIFRVFDVVSDKGTIVHNKVNHICNDAKGIIWFAVNGQGLFSYNLSTGILQNYFYNNNVQELSANIRTFTPDNHGGLWIALYYDGLYHCDSAITDLVPVKDYNGIKLSNDNIEGILMSPSENDVVYLTSVKNGLCKYNIRTGQIQRLIPLSEDSLPNGLFCHKNKTLWMSTTNGLYRYDIISGEYQVIRSDNQDRYSLAHDYIFAVYLDQDDGLWVSTKYGGINYCSAAHQRFDKYYTIDGKPLKNYVISGMVEDGNGNVYICTEKGGLILFDSKKSNLSEIGPSSCKGVDFLSPCLDGRYLWLGSIRGIYRYELNTGSIRVYDALSKKADLPDDRIGAVHLTDCGKLYVGTTLGLSYYDRDRDCFESIEIFDGINITSIAEDSFAKLWISTYASGIFYYDPDKNEILRHFLNSDKGELHLPTDKISSIFVDSKDRVWAIGLTYGFSVYESSVGKFVSYDSKSHSTMETDVYFYALEDNDGHIWISSDKGLLEIEPHTMEMSRYTVADGLLDDVLKRGVLKSQNGDLYFASQSGFVKFNPSEFSVDFNNKIFISGFTIAGKMVKPSDQDSPLTMNVDLMEKINLKAGQNSFGFMFSVLDNASAKVRIQCQLEGLEKTWTDISSEREIFFYDVPAGRYVLKVRYSTDGEQWVEGHSPINLDIAEAFWKSNIAFIIYLMIACMFIAGVARRIHQQSQKRMIEQEEKSRIEREKTFLREKMEFFSEVIHEIKTPLTLMTTPLRTILESELITDERLRDNLHVINNSTNYMGLLVKELLDYMSVEEHGYILDIRTYDILSSLRQSVNNFTEIAKERGLTIEFECECESIIVGADRTAMVKVFNNLIHNAVKYADSWIRVTLEQVSDDIVIRFSNDGPPIPEDRRSDIFKPFVKFTTESQLAAQSFGIGLPMARKLVGIHGGTLELTDNNDCTEFKVIIPMNIKEIDDINSDSLNINPKLPYILLVEDSTELAQYLTKELITRNNILHASSAEKALKILETRTVDLILSDIGLPGMSGVDFCAYLHSNRKLRHIPVVILSAMSSVDVKIRCMENGAALYIEKPFSMKYLIACIENVIKTGKKTEDMILDSADALKTMRRMNIHDKDAEFMAKLDEVILKNLTDDTFGSKQLEQALFMSRSTLARKIKELYDMTPNDYLKNKRISVATQMLKQKNVRINEVATAVGFRSASYFTKCFKAVHGVLPAEYINENK